MMSTTDLCMHDLDPSTCSVCKYRDMPPVYLFGRNGPYHADAECAALLAERAGATKRGAEMAPAVVARPGSVTLDGRIRCTVCA